MPADEKRLFSIRVSKTELETSPVKEINAYLEGRLSLKNAEIAVMLWAWQQENETCFKNWQVEGTGRLVDPRLINLFYLGARRRKDPLEKVLKVATHPPTWWEKFKQQCTSWWKGENQ